MHYMGINSHSLSGCHVSLGQEQQHEGGRLSVLPLKQPHQLEISREEKNMKRTIGHARPWMVASLLAVLVTGCAADQAGVTGVSASREPPTA